MISIIIPTLNEEKILGQTLTALKKLNVVDYEIIVSDGHSTDRTVEIAKKYADKVVEHDDKTRQTIGQGRNAGAAVAKGEYLVFIDADVFIKDINDFFTKALQIFRDTTNLAGLTVFIKVLPDHATLSDKFFFFMVNLIFYVHNNIFHSGAAAGEFQMMPTQSFKQVKGFSETLAAGEDVDMFARLSKTGRTRSEAGLYIEHTSRRAHHLGWPSLLTLWGANFAFYKIRKKSYSKEWTVIR
jgi:glycosyltransferase involved in cell wall biosynthesis